MVDTVRCAALAAQLNVPVSTIVEAVKHFGPEFLHLLETYHSAGVGGTFIKELLADAMDLLDYGHGPVVVPPSAPAPAPAPAPASPEDPTGPIFVGPPPVAGAMFDGSRIKKFAGLVQQLAGAAKQLAPVVQETLPVLIQILAKVAPAA